MSVATAREEEKLIGLDEALARVDSGKYGKCLRCREPIPFERLMAVPNREVGGLSAIDSERTTDRVERLTEDRCLRNRP